MISVSFLKIVFQAILRKFAVKPLFRLKILLMSEGVNNEL